MTQSTDPTSPDAAQTQIAPPGSVTFYWRPGCPFCRSLWSGLERAGVEFTDVNIWDDPEAAAFVRSVANGNETVPTVTVGETSVVNPSAAEVVDLIRRAAAP